MYRKIIYLQYFWTIFVELPIKTLFYHFPFYKHCYTLLMSLTVSKAFTRRISCGCDFGHFKKEKNKQNTKTNTKQNKTKNKPGLGRVSCMYSFQIISQNVSSQSGQFCASVSKKSRKTILHFDAFSASKNEKSVSSPT